MSSLSPDPTLTVENVTRAMEKVTVDKRRRVWERVLGEGTVEEIYSRHSNEKEKLHSCGDVYVACKPHSSWKELVQKLYNCGVMAAAKEAKAFLQHNGGWFIVQYILGSVHTSQIICSCLLLSYPKRCFVSNCDSDT